MARDAPPVGLTTTPPSRLLAHVTREKRLRAIWPYSDSQRSSPMRPHRVNSDTRQSQPTSCPYCLVNEHQGEAYLELENSMARHRVNPHNDKLSPLGKPPPAAMAPSTGPRKWRSAISSILFTIGRRQSKDGQQQKQKQDSVQWLIDSGEFQESDRQVLQEHLHKLPSSYASSGFSAVQVKEHMELLQEASRLKDGFVALRLEVSSIDEDSCTADVSTSDSSCTSSAGGFSTLSSDGCSQICRLDVSFAAPTHICRPDLASALRQAGFSLSSLTIFDSSPRGSLGQLAAKVYRDEFSKEVLENIFTSLLEQQHQQNGSSKRWLPIGVRRISGEYMRDNQLFADRQCGSDRGGTLARNTGNDSGRRGSPFRSHRRTKMTSTGDVEGMLQVLNAGDKKSGKQDITKFILDPLKVELGPVIAVGASGEVRKGTYEGKEVAVKILKSSMVGKDSKAVVAEFRREVLTLMACGECPHLLKFYGIFIDVRSRMCIVTKFMRGGTLHDYLQGRKGEKLPMKELLQIATDVAAGMEFLHKNGITHRDLKSANVLRDGEGHAVVGDFGVAKLKGERGEMTKEVGTYRWMAPEAFGTSAWPVTHKADVYSFGIVLWELVSLSLPFESYTPVQAAVAVTLNGLRPAIPADCRPELRLIIERCWAKNPADRPEFSSVLAALRRLE